MKRHIAAPKGLGAIIVDSDEAGSEAYIRVSILGHDDWYAPDGSRVDDGFIEAVLAEGGQVVTEGQPWEPWDGTPWHPFKYQWPEQRSLI